MAERQYTTEEVCRRGQELYDTIIRPRVEAGNRGKVLVIDIETGEYEMDSDQLEAAHRLLARHPGAPLYGVRIGYPTLAKIGGGWGATAQSCAE